MDEKKSPTKEQIDEALWNAGSGPAYILTAAYRAALARAELAERHYRAVWELYDRWCGTDIKAAGASMKARHERERKELEA
ncbi:MAG: hypothetical protein WC455_23810 [Dehalococcoidia bacterium]|jgi:hypothetical protein